MAEAPKEWLGKDVTISYGLTYQGQDEGVLESVSDRGVVLRILGGHNEEVRKWYPTTSIAYIKLGINR